MKTINDIPSEFKIANQVYTIEVVTNPTNEQLDADVFGKVDFINAKITLYTELYDDDNNVVNLSDEQVLNSFYHELFHCFNYHTNTETHEWLAQSFANFMREYEATAKYNK